MTGVVFLPNSIETQVFLPTDSDWQKYLNTVPHDFYHLPGYLELEAQRYNATAEAIVIKNGAEVFFLPYLIRECDRIIDSNTLNSDRVYDIISPYGYPGMLVSEAGQNPSFIKKCLNIIYGYWQEKNICSAFLRLHPILNSYIDRSMCDRHEFHNASTPQARLHQRGDVIICDLTNDKEQIWKQFRSSHRTKINKLKRSGFIVKMVPAQAYLDVFIDIYLETMSRVNATQAYYFTHDYFCQLLRVLGEGVQICIVEIDDRVIAASMITEFSGIVQYHLGGTRTEFLPYSPTTLVFDYTIEWAKQRNNRYFNLGGGLSGDRDSLYHFKAGFSHQTKSFATLETIVDRHLYARLTSLRAESLGMTTSELNNASFFPAYRSN
jgi:Acetyltransferase (GNAT) domain